VLWGRFHECEVLDRLLETVRAGQSGALVVRGEPGVGKSALLDYVAGRASGCRVARGAGMQSEMELAFSGLDQLCAPMLDRVDRLPEPQRDALRTAFGLAGGAAPDRFLVGLAVLSLLSEVAGEEPLVCLVDDAQWLDQASAQALAFVARRLGAESVALIFAVREPSGCPDVTGLPELRVGGLGDDDGRALLASVIRWPLDERVRDRIVAETHGNPLALLELPRGLTPAQLAGGFGLPSVAALPGRIEDSFAQRLAPLPAATRRLLLLAAAEPLGDSALLVRAADRLGIKAEAGVIGITGVGIFLGPNTPTLEAITQHLEYVADLIGIEHVGVSTDFSFDYADIIDEFSRNAHLFDDSYTRWGRSSGCRPKHSSSLAATFVDVVGTQAKSLRS